MNLTAIILTQSPQINSKLLDSLNFAHEILILHDGKPKSLYENKDTKTVHHIYHDLGHDFADHRNYALENTTGEWSLFLDEDEYVGRELAREIKTILEDTNYSGFTVPRRDVVFFNEVKHGEVGQVNILRLAKTKAGKFERPVHETWKINGRIGKLNNFIYHTKDSFVSDFLGKINQYATIDATALKTEGKPFSYFRLFFYPKAKFILNYFLKKGFLDGHVGLFYAYLLSVQSLSIRVFQWELAQKSSS